MVERGIENNLHVVDEFHRMNMATNSPVEVDGEHRTFQDKLLEELVGKRQVNGKIAGQQIEQYCEADWVLNHQFLRVYFIDSATRNRRVEESLVMPSVKRFFIGYDNMSERYVVHWIDILGGRFSETLGYGTLQGQDSIRLVFEGPGPLHNTVTWNLKDMTWTTAIKQKDENGKWRAFADEILSEDKVKGNPRDS